MGVVKMAALQITGSWVREWEPVRMSRQQESGWSSRSVQGLESTSNEGWRGRQESTRGSINGDDLDGRSDALLHDRFHCVLGCVVVNMSICSSVQWRDTHLSILERSCRVLDDRGGTSERFLAPEGRLVVTSINSP